MSKCTRPRCKECGGILSEVMGDDMNSDTCIDCVLGIEE